MRLKVYQLIGEGVSGQQGSPSLQQLGEVGPGFPCKGSVVTCMYLDIYMGREHPAVQTGLLPTVWREATNHLQKTAGNRVPTLAQREEMPQSGELCSVLSMLLWSERIPTGQ